MDFYKNQPHVVRDRSKGQDVTSFGTEIGEITKQEIREAIVDYDKDEYREVFWKLMKEKKIVPTMREVMIRIVKMKYYPGLLNPILIIPDRDNWDSFISAEIVEPIRISIHKRAEAKKKAKERACYSYYGACVGTAYACLELLRTDDGIFHIMDRRIDGDDNRQKPLDFFLKNSGSHGAEMTVQGIKYVFENFDMIGDVGNAADIIQWYIDVSGLGSNLQDLAELLKEKSKDKSETVRKIALLVYEENQASLAKIYAKQPDLDFVDKGHYEEYADIDKIAKIAGLSLETEEFFPGNPGEPDAQAVSGRRPRTRIKSDETIRYGNAILDCLKRFHTMVSQIATTTKIFNIKPNEIKKRKTQVFGKYVAVAAKVDDEWWIVIDAISKNNAIYLWHGKVLVEGLEHFKLTKSYARDQENVDHKNHNQDKSTLEIYFSICRENGLRF